MAIAPLDVSGNVESHSQAVVASQPGYALPDELRAKLCRRVMRLSVACPTSQVRYSVAEYLSAVDGSAPVDVLSERLRQIDDDLHLLKNDFGFSKMVDNLVDDLRDAFNELYKHFLAIT